MATVLLIEDVVLVRDTLCKFLERGQHEVVCCDGGRGGWEMFKSRRFDVVVTDLWMKDGDGLEFIHRLRANAYATPVIAVTGGDPRSPQASSAIDAAQAGASRVLVKPLTKALLLETVADVIREQKNSPQGNRET